ncbi:phenylacetate--CoA ligase [Baekduia soli]|uniref:Phenylacetate--CoA ligase n=1 Tax=Baekduia soli TaxID=496014 RepID=A0A5B8U294_9ACTN|nr:AMP-binding protein [Baekduia soli]QEC46975.1 phenylacetate--CoA ligase [Baekduia soli]
MPRPDPIELEPWKAVAGRQLELFTAQLQGLRERSAFHRRRLEAAGIGPDFAARSWDDLRRVPFTEKADVRASLAADPPLGSHLGVPLDQVAQVQATSGTTGSPSYIGLTDADVQTWAQLGARAFRASGVRPADRVLHAWSMSKGFAGGVPVMHMLRTAGATILPIGAEAGVERLLVVARDLGATVVCTAPNFALYLGERAPDILGVAARDLGVRALVVGGEPGGGIPAVRERIEETWGATCREVLGNSDIATIIWAECEAGDGMHFIGHDLVLAELIDPVTGEHVEPEAGAVGEIVYSALQREASAHLRFRSRDHVEVLGTGRCSCGRTSYRLRCFGRTDDMLLVRGINVWPTAVQEIVTAFRPRTTGAMRIVADFEGHSTQRPLRVEVERAPGEGEAALADDLTRSIHSRLVFSADVAVLEPGTLARPGAAKVQLVHRVADGA